jgi:ABC-type Mn2+/Zn2+ transport system ATPase subunit
MIKVENLSFYFGQNCIFDDISFNVVKNEFISIIGPNGCGKTTLLKLLLGLIKPQKGNILINDSKVNSVLSRKKHIIGYINQGAINTHLPINVSEVITLGAKIYSRKKYESILDFLNLENLEKRLYKTLSFGQKQKVNIARCLLEKQEILFLDEPNTFLDYDSQIEIIELIKKININDHITVLMVSHNFEAVGKYSDRIFLINNKKVNELKPENFNHQLLNGNKHL